MRKQYPGKMLLLASFSILILAIASCGKGGSDKQNTTVATPTQLGLYEADSAQYRELEVAISSIGTQSVNYGLVFDTGSGGMVIDANGILPASIITSAGFSFTGDSTVVDGITITKQTSTLQYGADSATLTTVYGNLAYAEVTVGDQNGKILIKRLPFCLYYKAVEAGGTTLPSHYFDTFGVNSEYIYFSGNSFITSPFSYYTYGTGLTRGFKMAQLNNVNFSYDGNYVSNAVTLGLTAADLETSSGFVMHDANFYQGDGYVPIFPTTITYGGNTVTTDALFDTGTSGYSYVEDPNATSDISTLPQNTVVTLKTTAGFSYTYTISSIENLTYLENPNLTGGEFTIFSIDFFLGNEYLLDFANEKVGLKNN